MADIYIIYSTPDRAIAAELAGELSKQWSVRWDDVIVGSFVVAVERELLAAKVIVPIWSIHSRESDYVRDGLTLAKKNNIVMIPVRVDRCDTPYGFGNLSIVELGNWQGDSGDPGVRQLMRRIASVVPPQTAPARPSQIADGRLELPTIFMSVSSHETQLSPIEAVKALRVFKSPTMLISAYDLVPRRIQVEMHEELIRFKDQGGFILIDSGNYEASRLDDAAWSPDDLALVLSEVPHDWTFCFDEMNPSAAVSESADQIVAAVERDRNATHAPVLPIVHAHKRNGRYAVEEFPAVVREVSHRLEPPMVAVPERELGSGIMARAATVRRIRSALADLPFYQPLHLLGTGNPWSIAILAAAGADSFDGLEWCRMIADRNSGRLHHYQHFDLFAYQARLAESPIAANAVDDDAVEFTGKVAFHNLDFFASFAAELTRAAGKGGFDAFLTGWLGQANTRQVRDQLPGLFG